MAVITRWSYKRGGRKAGFHCKRKVEMRKFDCNSFRITVNTDFKKKLTSSVSKSVWGNPAMKVSEL